MDYAEARKFISGLTGGSGLRQGQVMGLDAVKELLHRLQDPQEKTKVIHIGGTNGKGSVSTFVASVLEQAGYRVGRYVSPTLFSYRERMQINGGNITREDYAEVITEIAKAMKGEYASTSKMPVFPSAFEAETAAAFLYFLKKNCDFAVVEEGMGGRTDATNVLSHPALTVLTSISKDHMDFLGNSLGEIAWNKTGIFKEKVPVVSAWQEEEAAAVIRAEAQKKHCPCTFVDKTTILEGRSYDAKNAAAGANADGVDRECFAGNDALEKQSFFYRDYGEITIQLLGRYQQENAALALECIGALRRQGVQISDLALKEGMRAASWKGRFSLIHKNPYVVLDGAHNPDAAVRLREAILESFPEQKKYYIMGVFSDKDYDTIIDSTADLAEHIVTVETPLNPRALPAEELAKAVSRVNPSVEAAKSVSEAVERCFALAQAEDVIVIFGSLSYLAEAEKAVQAQDRIYQSYSCKE
ncbi:MAG: bifunctional folylpolyglutamate synthase/dihydrofolate synthase [Lachnospiraceae bacterium]|nr:bifunctional folylpolyglutamate synthase/dihydrofolate synthase [Lachnospiraceae bacterium]